MNARVIPSRTLSLLSCLFPLFSHSQLPPICLAALPPSASPLLHSLWFRRCDFCPLYFKPSTFWLPPGYETSCRCLSCVFGIFYSRTSASFSSGKVFALAALCYHSHIVLLTDIFLKPTTLIQHASSRFCFRAWSYALVIQLCVCISSSSSSSAFFSAALRLPCWPGSEDARAYIVARLCVWVRVPPWMSVTSNIT